ncbi:PTS beta-glucoside transporter subunit EIIBCA [Flavonifractor sp. An135]|nr:PTS transporter subunit IIBCA [Flavonifractor sp. An135]OUQ24917.1 PTS beta-glucoside transporter subunit EIIBCA [Flavonifractor sp. An135]
MDYRKCAQEIFQQVGGRENLVSAAHCATRLRLVIADNNKLNMKALENIDGVKGVFSNAGQLQLILGTGTVNKVYDEFLAVSGMTAATKEEVKAAAAARQPLPKRMVKALGDVFVPILPAIVASGLIMGLLEGLCKAFPALADSGTYTIFHLFSNAAFVFLPILVAISAARVFGGNIFLGAVIGMIMIHTDLVNAWSVADYVANGTPIPSADVWFSLYNINLTGYQGHVIPVIIAVWIMCQIEERLHKIVPEMLDLFITPLVTVCVTGYLTLTIFGPVFSTVENWVLTGVQMLITIPFGIGAALMGAIYPLTVVCGVHHMYNVIEAGMLSSTGLNTWMPIASAANFAQGAACLAVALKTRDRKTKALALPSAMSAALGITEPAIFGVNLRLVKPLVAGMIGGAAGSVVGSMFHIGATAYGVTGLFGFLTTTDYLVPYAIELAVSFAVAFAVSWFLYKEEAPTAADAAPQAGEQPVLSAQSGVVGCPMTGKVIPMADIPDATFAAGVLGEGCGIEPAEGRVVAPFDGVVTTVADTRHALGLSSPDGMELLIHVGINTVELAGEGFTLHCAEGDTVKAGQVLLDVDLDRICKGGYSTTTAVLLTNAEDLGEPTVALGQHREGEPILTIPAAVPAK